MRTLLILSIITFYSIFQVYGQVRMNFVLMVNDTLQEDVVIEVEIEYKNGTKKSFLAGYVPGELWIDEISKKDIPKIKKIRFEITPLDKTYEFVTENQVQLLSGSFYFFELSYFVIFFYDLKYFPQYKPQDPKKDYVIKIWYPDSHTILIKKTDNFDYLRQ